jgi:hypothetical protein
MKKILPFLMGAFMPDHPEVNARRRSAAGGHFFENQWV